MPELPEVETVRRDLAKRLRGAVISEVLVGKRKMVSPARSFSRSLVGQRITDVDRRGKLLIFSLHDGLRLHVHLKMTGQLVYRKGSTLLVGGHAIAGATKVPNAYTHLTVRFRDGGELFLNDPRQFGYARVLSGTASAAVVQRYGPEPLAKDFTLARFEAQLANRPRTSIKAALLNQSVLAGVGNIYADEACFRAGLRPDKLVQFLTPDERRRLWLAIRYVLTTSVRLRGTSRSTYRHNDPGNGRFWPRIAVYGRAGYPCRTCATSLVRDRVAGRGTVYCPMCQH